MIHSNRVAVRHYRGNMRKRNTNKRCLKYAQLGGKGKQPTATQFYHSDSNILVNVSEGDDKDMRKAGDVLNE